MPKISKDGKRTIHLHNPSAIQFLEEYALRENIPLYKAMERIIIDQMTVDVVDAEPEKQHYTYVHFPEESVYLQEIINAFLVNYNTVGIQKTGNGDYIIRLEGEVY